MYSTWAYRPILFSKIPIFPLYIQPKLYIYNNTWVPDNDVVSCQCCGIVFTLIMTRRHHCRHCGQVVCGNCCRRELVYHTKSSLPRIQPDNIANSLYTRALQYTKVITNTTGTMAPGNRPNKVESFGLSPSISQLTPENASSDRVFAYPSLSSYRICIECTSELDIIDRGYNLGELYKSLYNAASEPQRQYDHETHLLISYLTHCSQSSTLFTSNMLPHITQLTPLEICDCTNCREQFTFSMDAEER